MEIKFIAGAPPEPSTRRPGWAQAAREAIRLRPGEWADLSEAFGGRTTASVYASSWVWKKQGFETAIRSSDGKCTSFHARWPVPK